MILKANIIKYALIGALISLFNLASAEEEKTSDNMVYANKKNTKIYKNDRRGAKVLERVDYGAAFTVVKSKKNRKGWIQVSFGDGNYGYIQDDDVYYYDPYYRNNVYDDGYYESDYYDASYGNRNRHRNRGRDRNSRVREMRESERQVEVLRQQQHQLRPTFDYEKRRR